MWSISEPRFFERGVIPRPPLSNDYLRCFRLKDKTAFSCCELSVPHSYSSLYKQTQHVSTIMQTCHKAIECPSSLHSRRKAFLTRTCSFRLDRPVECKDFIHRGRIGYIRNRRVILPRAHAPKSTRYVHFLQQRTPLMQ